MNNHYKVMAIALSAVFFLSGCQMNTIPDMSKEQSGLIAQYAANLILTNNKKHDTGIATQAEIEKEDAKKERQRLREEATQKVEEQTQKSLDSDQVKNITAVVEDSDPAQFLGLQDIVITYQGNEICDDYTEDESEECFFAINATEGNQLLVLKFQIQNNSAESKEIDILNQYPLFKISVNGGAYTNVLTTLLLNDLSTYKGTLAAGESEEEVLIIQLSDAETKEGIQSLILRTKLNNQNIDTKLQ